MLLTIDQGNSTTDCCLFDGDVVRRRERLAASADAVRAFVGRDAVARLVALCVRPDRLELLRECATRVGVRLELAGTELPCPLRNGYHRPAELGVDRWVGAYAAHRRFGTALTIDCGTAVTLNLVTADGEFRGGAITSGFSTLVRGLAAAAPVLTADVSQAPQEIPARSTVEALRLGLRVGFAGMVERVAQDLLARCTAAATVVVTGGEAHVFLAHARLACVHVPDLNHQGLRLLALPR